MKSNQRLSESNKHEVTIKGMPQSEGTSLNAVVLVDKSDNID